jgi:hypothetical protein
MVKFGSILKRFLLKCQAELEILLSKYPSYRGKTKITKINFLRNFVGVPPPPLTNILLQTDIESANLPATFFRICTKKGKKSIKNINDNMKEIFEFLKTITCYFMNIDKTNR